MSKEFFSLETSFKKDFGHLSNVRFNGVGYFFGADEAVISITRPFIFDVRRLPKYYKNLRIHSEIPTHEIPKEFQVERGRNKYIWAYKRYEKYVDRCIEQIRLELNDPNLTKEEALNALCPGNNFKDWIQYCQAMSQIGEYY